jgi:pimeloyl-ACP methyl ester carboxylesterase
VQSRTFLGSTGVNSDESRRAMRDNGPMATTRPNSGQSRRTASLSAVRGAKAVTVDDVEPKTILLHGRPLSYVEAGSGPVLLLIHGMAGNLGNWRPVIGPLARRYTVIAPDLPGHGESAPGGGDYSLGALAASLRDLLIVLGHERATLVGHSLGGGIAMQFAYQFPEATERLVLVSSGGLGPEVSAILRAAALPGADLFIAATASLGTSVGNTVARGLAAVGLRPSADIAEVARGYASLAERDRRAAFLATLRGVVGTRGQRVHAGDRLYLAEDMPVLIIWGERDPILPVAHARGAHELIPRSRLEIFEGVGHLPQIEAPARFATVLERFIVETDPSRFDSQQWRGRLRTASDRSA